MKDDQTAQAVQDLARAINRGTDLLGTNGAATGLGALELLSKEIRDGSSRIADALAELADAIRSVRE